MTLARFLLLGLAFAGPSYVPPAGGGGAATTAETLPAPTILSPAALAADANNLDVGAPTIETVVRLDPDANVDVTGIADGVAGMHLRVCNVDAAFRVRLADQSASSTAANRIETYDPAGAMILPGSCRDLTYDGVSSRWRQGDSEQPQTVILGTDWSDSVGTLIDVTGMSCSTRSGATYLVEVRGSFFGAVNTTGIQWGIVSTGSTGSVLAQSPTSITAMATSVNTSASDAAVLGTASLITQTPIAGWAVVTSTGNAIQLRARTEVATSAVTLSAFRTIMTCRRIN